MIPSVGKNYHAWGNLISTAILRVKHILKTNSSTSRWMILRAVCEHVPRDVCKMLVSSIVYNSPKWETV